MKKLANFLKKDRHGFTLVEIIVVLAILAILVAVAIPSLTGILNESKGKVLMQDARAALVAYQLKTTEGVLPTKAQMMTLMDKTAAEAANISIAVKATGAPADGDYKIVAFVYCDTAKKSGNKAVCINLDDTAVIYDTLAAAKTASGATELA